MRCLKPVDVRCDIDGLSVVQVPCGKCIACRINRSGELAGRIQREHERQIKLGRTAWFGTFTYDDEHLPADNSLSKREITLFMHRVRRRMHVDKYFFCGEYGSRNGRAHYHGVFFSDESNERIVFDVLNESWNLGFIYIKPMHLNTAKYVAKYIVKFDDRDLDGRTPPFVQMSLRFGTSDLYSDIKSIRYLSSVDAPYVYRDALGRKHPYPRKSISKSFTPSEKIDNMFRASDRSDDALKREYSRLRPPCTFKEFKVAYENSRHDNFEARYWKNQFYKKH